MSEMDDSGYDTSGTRTTATPGVELDLSDVDHPMTGLQRREVLTTASDLVTDTQREFSVTDTDSGREFDVYFLSPDRTVVSRMIFRESAKFVFISSPFTSDSKLRFLFYKGEFLEYVLEDGKFVAKPLSQAAQSRLDLIWVPPEMNDSNKRFAIVF